MPRSAKICVSSLGCSKNLVDTEVMLGSLAKSGLEITGDESDADIYVINTCSFIGPARDESNETIAKALKWKKKRRSRKVVVAGCLAQREPEETQKAHSGIDLMLGLDEIASIGTMVQNMLRKLDSVHTFVKEDLPVYLYDENTPRLLVTPAHYAYVKISEGCNHKCSFCAIPTFRGKLRSRAVQSLVKECQALLNRGVHELILVSQNATDYGSDFGDGTSLSMLLRALDDLKAPAGEYWIRVLYLYPTSVTDELIQTFAEAKHVLKYIDMPLQHASANMLTAMRRGITPDRTTKLLAKFRDRIPGVTMRTTLLVGHPGEKEDDFAALQEFIRHERFDRVGVFTYSHEKNTHAFGMENDVPNAVAKERESSLMLAQQEISKEKNQALVGQTLRVIIDEVLEDDDGVRSCTGRSGGDAPDVDNMIHFPWSEAIGDKIFVSVKILSADAHDLKGVVAD